MVDDSAERNGNIVRCLLRHRLEQLLDFTLGPREIDA